MPGLLRNALAVGLAIRDVLADDGHGDATAFRAARHAAQPAYAVGIASTTSVSCRSPQPHAPTRSAQVLARRHPRPALAKDHTAMPVSALAAVLPWRRVS